MRIKINDEYSYDQLQYSKQTMVYTTYPTFAVFPVSCRMDVYMHTEMLFTNIMRQVSEVVRIRR